MAVNKVEYAGNTLIDLTGDTVDASKMLGGVTAHDKAGNPITGTIAAATQATPSISVSSGGLITASATQSAGYVESGTKSATKQLTTPAAKTITPSASSQTAVESGRYTTGAVTVQGDSNLVAGNIKSGVSIFGVTGTYEGSGGGDSGGGGGVETCTVTVTNNLGSGVAKALYFNYTAFIDGVVSAETSNVRGAASVTLNNVVRNSVGFLWALSSSVTFSDIVVTNGTLWKNGGSVAGVVVGTDGTDVSITVS